MSYLVGNIAHFVASKMNNMNYQALFAKLDRPFVGTFFFFPSIITPLSWSTQFFWHFNHHIFSRSGYQKVFYNFSSNKNTLVWPSRRIAEKMVENYPASKAVKATFFKLCIRWWPGLSCLAIPLFYIRCFFSRNTFHILGQPRRLVTHHPVAHIRPYGPM